MVLGLRNVDEGARVVELVAEVAEYFGGCLEQVVLVEFELFICCKNEQE